MDANSDKQGSRRKFLKTAGKFAVYTPPALMLMSKPGSQVFANSGGSTVDNGDTTTSTSTTSTECGGELASSTTCDVLRQLGML